MRRIFKFVGLFLILIILLGIFVGYPLIAPSVPPNLKDYSFKIRVGTTMEQVEEDLIAQGFITDASSFRRAARLLSYRTVLAGRYVFNARTSVLRIVRTLEQGRQTPVQLVLHNKRTIPQVAGFLGKQFEADSAAFMRVLADSTFLAKFGYTVETAMTAFIPNTYQIFWNTPPDVFFEKMTKEHDKFWTEERRKKAAALGLSLVEVYTLASIVESESQYQPERPTIAGVYLNRLRENMRLQADPTLVFALGDFSVKRVYNYMKEIDSPYNTYKNKGLPPGPIYMSSISSIDAVLDAEQHDYLYFCAKPGSKGHAFAVTYEAQQVNARLYREWLNRQNIR